MQEENDLFDVVKDWIHTHGREVFSLIPRRVNEQGGVESGVVALGHNESLQDGETIGVEIHVVSEECKQAFLDALRTLPESSEVRKFLLEDTEIGFWITGENPELFYALDDSTRPQEDKPVLQTPKPPAP